VSKDFWLVLAGIVCAALYSGGMVYLGYTEGHKGVAQIQSAWDAQKKVDVAAAKEAKLHSDAETDAMRRNYNLISGKYDRLLNAQLPSIADTIPASLSAGTLQLRYETTCPANHSDAGAKATAASRARDAAATQALADRVAASIAAVRVGDASDARERQLDAQIDALQEVVNIIYSNKETVSNGGH
jgi:membrane protein involved in colicin uptake